MFPNKDVDLPAKRYFWDQSSSQKLKCLYLEWIAGSDIEAYSLFDLNIVTIENAPIEPFLIFDSAKEALNSLQDFILDHKNCIIYFADNSDDRHFARIRLFDEWMKDLSIRDLICLVRKKYEKYGTTFVYTALFRKDPTDEMILTKRLLTYFDQQMGEPLS